VIAVHPFGYREARQRTSSDLKLPPSGITKRVNPHVHAVFLDGAYRDKGDELDFRAVGHLSSRDVAAVLERTRDRMVKYLRRRGLLLEDGDAEDEGDGLAVLAASAVSGTTPPAGPEWRRGALPFERRGMVFERPLCVALDGFPPSGITKRVTLHAATRAGGLDVAGREALLKYVLRPAVAQESPFGDHEARRVTRGPDGLVRITLKKPFSDGTGRTKTRDRGPARRDEMFDMRPRSACVVPHQPTRNPTPRREPEEPREPARGSLRALHGRTSASSDDRGSRTGRGRHGSFAATATWASRATGQKSQVRAEIPRGHVSCSVGHP
jgi:hypothetical protein